MPPRGFAPNSMFPDTSRLPYQVKLDGHDWADWRHHDLPGPYGQAGELPFQVRPQNEVFLDQTLEARPQKPLEGGCVFDRSLDHLDAPNKSKQIRAALAILEELKFPREVALMILDYADLKLLRVVKRKCYSCNHRGARSRWHTRSSESYKPEQRVLVYEPFVRTDPIRGLDGAKQVVGLRAEVGFRDGLAVPDEELWQSLDFAILRGSDLQNNRQEKTQSALHRVEWAIERGNGGSETTETDKNRIRWVSYQPFQTKHAFILRFDWSLGKTRGMSDKFIRWTKRIKNGDTIAIIDFPHLDNVAYAKIELDLNVL
ncbi:MAG: hypothetical protein M1828_005791 [Chrysothrix sp. TS-e1954]|nr:MAG: hypothetical protein M1828_005791 [Chrysothrix sp. TS-e1954]